MEALTLYIIGIGGSTSRQTRGIVNLTLLLNTTVSSIVIRAHVLRKVPSILPSFTINPQSWPHLRKLKLADPVFLNPRVIDIIIGADFNGPIIKPSIIKQTPLAHQLPIFGWLVSSPAPRTHQSIHASYFSERETLQHFFIKFWVQY